MNGVDERLRELERKALEGAPEDMVAYVREIMLSLGPDKSPAAEADRAAPPMIDERLLPPSPNRERMAVTNAPPPQYGRVHVAYGDPGPPMALEQWRVSNYGKWPDPDQMVTIPKRTYCPDDEFRWRVQALELIEGLKTSITLLTRALHERGVVNAPWSE